MSINPFHAVPEAEKQKMLDARLQERQRLRAVADVRERILRRLLIAALLALIGLLFWQGYRHRMAPLTCMQRQFDAGTHSTLTDFGACR